MKEGGKFLDAVNRTTQLGLNAGSTFADGGCQLWRFLPVADGWGRAQKGTTHCPPTRLSGLLTAVLAAVVAAGCNADVAGAPAPGTAGTGSLGGSAATGGMSTTMAGAAPDGSLPSPVCQAGSVVPAFHRLNRIQYQNSVNALLGTDLPLAEDLPVDALVYGFDNDAGVSMSATLMQKYFNVAEAAVNSALGHATTRAKLVPCTGADQACAARCWKSS